MGIGFIFIAEGKTNNFSSGFPVYRQIDIEILYCMFVVLVYIDIDYIIYII